LGIWEGEAPGGISRSFTSDGWKIRTSFSPTHSASCCAVFCPIPRGCFSTANFGGWYQMWHQLCIRTVRPERSEPGGGWYRAENGSTIAALRRRIKPCIKEGRWRILTREPDNPGEGKRLVFLVSKEKGCSHTVEECPKNQKSNDENGTVKRQKWGKKGICGCNQLSLTMQVNRLSNMRRTTRLKPKLPHRHVGSHFKMHTLTT
jgi:hypothetical protein